MRRYGPEPGQSASFKAISESGLQTVTKEGTVGRGYQVEKIKADLLIIGSEGAGCMAAIGAGNEAISILMVTKGLWGRSGATVAGGS